MSRSYSIGSPNMFDIRWHIFVWTVVFTHETKKGLRNIRMNVYQFVTNNESSRNTNVKSEINKLSTNKRCQFPENIVHVNETSEQNSNGYCNVDIVFTLDPTNASFICGIMVIFSIMNLFLKCITSDLKFLSTLWIDIRSICYILCNNMHCYWSGKWHRKCKQ